MNEDDFFWLVGILEGEGSFYIHEKTNSLKISVTMIDEDTVIKIAKLIESSVYKYHSGKDKGWSETYTAQVKGKKALNLMRTLKPHMGERRQLQIEKAIRLYKEDKKSAVKKKLTNQQEIELATLYQSKKITVNKLAEIYKIHRKTVREIANRVLSNSSNTNVSNNNNM